jgi:hypothetical protein
MRLPALKHLIEAVEAIAQSRRIRVFGSSSLLASFPELGEAHGPLEKTFDADLLIEPCDEQLAEVLHEALGEGSLFSQRTGYHADILRSQIVETVSPGWEERLVRVGTFQNVTAIAPPDLVVMKLRAGRRKDLDLCRDLVRRRLLSTEAIRSRLDATPLDEPEIVSVYERLRQISV